MKYTNAKMILTLTATLSAIVIGCQVGTDRVNTSNSQISDFSEAKDCGMLVTVGQSSTVISPDGKFARLPAPITLTAQIIACGNTQADLSENWHAIGVGIERNTVTIEDRKAGTSVQAQPVLESDGTVNLYVNNAVAAKLGQVPLPEVGMPVGMDTGISFEIRAGSAKISLVSAKSTPADQMSLWFVK